MPGERTGVTMTKRLPRILRVIHWIILGNYLSNILYAAYQLFFVLKPPGGKAGPLWGQADDLAPDLMAARRGYAAEAWLSTAGLTTYLALTEYLPRILARPATGEDGTA